MVTYVAFYDFAIFRTIFTNSLFSHVFIAKARILFSTPCSLLIRLVRAEARIAYHVRYWYKLVASAFSLRYHYRAVPGWQR